MATTPFAALTLIAAPAILTNASSVLAMSTSNRLARAVDRGRELARELDQVPAGTRDATTERRLRELAAADVRSILLLHALSAAYTALAGFAAGTLLSLFGAVLADYVRPSVLDALELGAAVAGAIAVGGVVWCAAILVRETRIAVTSLRERIAEQQARFTRVQGAG